MLLTFVTYDNIIKALNASAGSLCSHKKAFNIKPGWNEYVAEHHAAAREAFKRWSSAGRHRQGDVFEYKKQTNARCKYALRHIKTNRADLLARKLQNNHVDFWKAIKVMNSFLTVLRVMLLLLILLI